MGKHIQNTACPNCSTTGKGSSLSVYDDGHYCHECGYRDKGPGMDQKNMKNYKYSSIPSRKINKKTCEVMGIAQADFTGYLGTGKNKKYLYQHPVAIFEHTHGGRVTNTKIRCLQNRSLCLQQGDTSNNKLFAQGVFHPSPKRPIIITEGEFDAAVIYQETGFPTVSVTRGAQGAAKQLKQNLEWLQKWDYVVLAFDNDEAGQAAVEASIPIFDIGKCRVVRFPLKDANDMLLADRGYEIKKYLYNAELYKPSSILELTDDIKSLITKPEMGIPWPWDCLTEYTNGFQFGKLFIVAAAPNIGKTQFIKELVFNFIDHNINVAWYNFEQTTKDSILSILSSKLNKPLDDPQNTWWDEEAISKAYDEIKNYITLFNTDQEEIKNIDDLIMDFKYQVKCFNSKVVILDNLTAMCSNPIIDGKHVSEFQYEGYIASRLFNIVKPLGISVFLLSHLAKDKIGLSTYVTTSPKNEEEYLSMTSEKMGEYINRPGLTWDTGRMPQTENIAGHKAIPALADVVMVMGRNRLSTDVEERTTMRVRITKNRLNKRAQGAEFKLKYNYDTGQLTEV